MNEISAKTIAAEPSAAIVAPNIRLQRNCEGIDWLAVKQMYRMSDFDNGRPPGMLRRSFAGSYTVCFAVTDQGQVVGTGRAISDGIVSATLFDVCVHPDFRRRSIGTSIVRALMDSLDGQYVLFVTDAPEFYRSMNFGFRPEPNAMAVP